MFLNVNLRFCMITPPPLKHLSIPPRHKFQIPRNNPDSYISNLFRFSFFYKRLDQDGDLTKPCPFLLQGGVKYTYIGPFAAFIFGLSTSPPPTVRLLALVNLPQPGRLQRIKLKPGTHEQWRHDDVIHSHQYDVTQRTAEERRHDKHKRDVAVAAAAAASALEMSHTGNYKPPPSTSSDVSDVRPAAQHFPISFLSADAYLVLRAVARFDGPFAINLQV